MANTRKSRVPKEEQLKLINEDVYKRQESEKSLSESQRIFVDMAYRLATLEFFHKDSYFISETPDSTLDYLFEENAVKTDVYKRQIYTYDSTAKGRKGDRRSGSNYAVAHLSLIHIYFAS